MIQERHAKETQQATNSPGTIEIAGDVFLIQDLTPGEFTTLRQELRRQVLGDLKSPLLAIAADLKHLSPALQQMAIEAAVKQQPSGAEPTSEHLANQLLTHEGFTFHLSLMLRKAGNPINLEDLREKITEEEVNDYIERVWKALGKDDPKAKSTS